LRSNQRNGKVHSFGSLSGILEGPARSRRRAGLSQEQVAERIGETQTFVSKCERGERRIDVIELGTFCRAFGISLKQFVSALERAMSRTKRS
jgi:transcriptional regulator with XRE-family HTH domain